MTTPQTPNLFTFWGKQSKQLRKNISLPLGQSTSSETSTIFLLTGPTAFLCKANRMGTQHSLESRPGGVYHACAMGHEPSYLQGLKWLSSTVTTGNFQLHPYEINFDKTCSPPLAKCTPFHKQLQKLAIAPNFQISTFVVCRSGSFRDGKCEQDRHNSSALKSHLWCRHGTAEWPTLNKPITPTNRRAAEGWANNEST